jgi:transcriptional regulator with XRE-family HTH domain
MTLAEYLENNGLTADAFAGAVGVSPSALSRYLSGQRTPALEVAGKIMVASKGAVDFHDHLDKALARKVKAVRQ